MIRLDNDAFATLEQAVARWNGRANAAYLEVAERIGEVRRGLDVLTGLVAARRVLSPSLAVARARLEAVDLPPAQREERIEAAQSRLATLEESLADFHVELETLHLQTIRATASARTLAEGLKSLYDDGAAAPAADSQAGGAVAVSIPSATPREKQLASEVEGLREELQRFHAENEQLRARVANSSAPDPQSQAEIARLRTRVVELSLLLNDRSVPVDNDPSRQYEAILAQVSDAEGRRRKLGEILVAAHVISRDQLETALREQNSAWNRHLGAVLVDLGFINEDTVAQTLAAQVQVPYVRLIHDPPKREAVALIAKHLAYHHSCIPLRFEREKLVVALTNPLDVVALDDLQLASRKPIFPVVASAREIKAALQEHYR